MNLYYRCDDCAWTGAFPDELPSREISEFWGERDYSTTVELRCPECRGEVEEYVACLGDECEQEAQAGSDFCLECNARFEEQERQYMAAQEERI